MIIAMIGTREFSQQPGMMQARMMEAASIVGRNKDVCISGAAIGADQVMLRESVRYGALPHVVLPWRGYEQAFVKELQEFCTVAQPMTVTIYEPTVHAAWSASVKEFHPAPHRLTRGAFALHARNYGIIQPADAVCALPSDQGGGTGQGMRIGSALGIPVFNFRLPGALEEFIAWRTA